MKEHPKTLVVTVDNVNYLLSKKEEEQLKKYIEKKFNKVKVTK